MDGLVRVAIGDEVKEVCRADRTTPNQAVGRRLLRAAIGPGNPVSR